MYVKNVTIGGSLQTKKIYARSARSIVLYPNFYRASRVSILLLTRDIDIVILSVRPSVRLSVTRWYCMKTA